MVRDALAGPPIRVRSALAAAADQGQKPETTQQHRGRLGDGDQGDITAGGITAEIVALSRIVIVQGPGPVVEGELPVVGE